MNTYKKKKLSIIEARRLCEPCFLELTNTGFNCYTLKEADQNMYHAKLSRLILEDKGITIPYNTDTIEMIGSKYNFIRISINPYRNVLTYPRCMRPGEVEYLRRIFDRRFHIELY